MIDFISGPVSVGFTSAAAIIIATTQIKDVLGLSFPGSKFLDVWERLFEHISETRLWDTILGFTCMAILLLLRVNILYYGTKITCVIFDNIHLGLVQDSEYIFDLGKHYKCCLGRYVMSLLRITIEHIPQNAGSAKFQLKEVFSM